MWLVGVVCEVCVKTCNACAVLPTSDEGPSQRDGFGDAHDVNAKGSGAELASTGLGALRFEFSTCPGEFLAHLALLFLAEAQQLCLLLCQDALATWERVVGVRRMATHAHQWTTGMAPSPARVTKLLARVLLLWMQAVGWRLAPQGVLLGIAMPHVVGRPFAETGKRGR